MLPTDETGLLRPIYLHGSLGEQFGREHRLAVRSPAEAVRALTIQHRGFRQAIEEGSWRIVRGADPDRGLELGSNELRFNLGRAPLHIVPVAAGAGGRNGGIGKIIAGIALAAASFFIPGSSALLVGLSRAAFGVGVSMTLHGASALLTSKPAAVNGRAGVSERGSFLFNGPVNVSAQGGSVPLVFGRFRTGSVVISAGLSAEAI